MYAHVHTCMHTYIRMYNYKTDVLQVCSFLLCNSVHLELLQREATYKLGCYGEKSLQISTISLMLSEAHCTYLASYHTQRYTNFSKRY